MRYHIHHMFNNMAAVGVNSMSQIVTMDMKMLYIIATALLGHAISILQTFSHVNNIAYAIYRRISPHIAGNILYLMA